MTYDYWKTTNPEDEWLGPEPEDAMTEDQYREVKSICANMARITAMIASDFALLSKALSEWRAEQDDWRHEQQKININPDRPF